MNAEIIYDMPENLYHESTGLGEGQYLTRSMLKCYEESPRGFFERYVKKNPLAQVKPSPAFAFGSLVEALIIDDPWEDMFYIKCLKKEDPERFEKNKLAEANGLVEITQAQLDTARLTIEGMQYDERGQLLLSLMDNARHGVVVRYEDDKTGLKIQVRFDTIFPGVAIVDWKTGRDKPEKFCDQR
jgi:hypothetical protein